MFGLRLVLVTLGSRGDVDPFLALAGALIARGHQVRLVTQPDLAAGADGVELYRIDLGPTGDLLDLPAAKRLLRRPFDPRAIRQLMDALEPGFEMLYRATVSAVADADAVVCHPMTFPALDVAQHAGVPAVHLHHVPAIPTGRFPSPSAHRVSGNYGAIGNRLTYAVERRLAWRLTAPVMNRLRDSVLRRPPLSASAALALHQRRVGAVAAVSPRVLPRPADWPDDVVVSGYLQTRPGTVSPLDPDTRRFLDSGPPPVFVTLGSTPVPDAAAVARTVVAAASLSGHRLVVQDGTAKLGRGVTGENVHAVEAIDYAALLPRVAAVVHHGGAGTLAQILRHGLPSLALPSFADQFFWAHRIRSAGVGPRPLPLRRLTTTRLAGLLDELMTTGRYADRAAEIGTAIRREDGPAAAAAAIEAFLVRR
ncbi:glycosyltransferase family 1 protein [Dactylosporangium aurantiacum]|uniref:Glycosyltransferase family 1 protein n=1 Tax=Dactylosporangium aurantiacum TaxID=35754 RepID=A0A9Q9MAW5_9ACTN|nr:glycosyltransferase [Dactylosporangium aurantiacum]MDG6101924.1 glycosyltransferase [Dactylosporangium aurantiacum]UWZ52283.1 glycosyltransferase family 1 protein [Dactylosporangium aurantiacum]